MDFKLDICILSESPLLGLRAWFVESANVWAIQTGVGTILFIHICRELNVHIIWDIEIWKTWVHSNTALLFESTFRGWVKGQ